MGILGNIQIFSEMEYSRRILIFMNNFFFFPSFFPSKNEINFVFP